MRCGVDNTEQQQQQQQTSSVILYLTLKISREGVSNTHRHQTPKDECGLDIHSKNIKQSKYIHPHKLGEKKRIEC